MGGALFGDRLGIYFELSLSLLIDPAPLGHFFGLSRLI